MTLTLGQVWREHSKIDWGHIIRFQEVKASELSATIMNMETMKTHVIEPHAEPQFLKRFDLTTDEPWAIKYG